MSNSDEYGDWQPGGATAEQDAEDDLRRQALLDQMNTPPSGGTFNKPSDLPGPVVDPQPAPPPDPSAPPPIDVNLTPPQWNDFPTTPASGPTVPVPNDQQGPVIDGPGGGPAPAAAAPAPAPNPTPQPAATNAAVPGEGRSRAAAFFQSKGVEPFPTSLDSWERYWQTWGYKDPAYFNQRLAQADELTGVGPNYDWQAAGKKDPNPPGFTGGAPPPTSTAAGGSAPPPASAPFAPPASGSTDEQRNFGSDIRSMLMELLRQPPVSAGDADIAPAITANRDARQRALRKQQDDLAESFGRNNLLHSGSYDASVASANEVAASDSAQFAGNAVSQQALARRQQIVSLLQTGAGMLNADEQRQLQSELAAIDANLRQQGITNQNNQANDRLGYDIGTEQATLNRQAMLDAMGVHI